MRNLFPTERTLTPADFGPLEPIMVKLFAVQSEFLTALKDTSIALENSPTAAYSLIGIAFAYGVFHALGPGHGKAIVSAWAAADKETIRKGVAVSVLSSLLQSLTAIALVTIVFVILKQSSFVLNNATEVLTRLSGVLLIGFAILFLIKALKALLEKKHTHTCGCAHHDTESLSAKRLKNTTWLSAWPVILSVGIRPCTGALLTLTLAFSSGFILTGLLATMAMGVGTAITVSLIVSGVIGIRSVNAFNTPHTLRKALKAAIYTGVSIFFALFGLSLALF